MSKFFYLRSSIIFVVFMVLYFYFFLEKDENLSRFFLFGAVLQATFAYFFYRRHKAKEAAKKV